MLFDKKLFIYFTLGIIASVGMSYYIFYSERHSQEELVKEIATDKIEDTSPNTTSTSAQSVKLKPSPLKFQNPLPGDTEWKLNYDDEEDATEKTELISSIDLLSSPTVTPIETATVSPNSSPKASVSPIKEDFFTAKDLAELKEQGAIIDNSGLIGGKHVELKDSLDELEEESPSPSASPSPEPPWYTGQTRGYTMLYLMHPNARNTVLRQVEIMEKARIRKAYLSVLADGTFGLDYAFLEQIVRRLNASGMNLTLGIYFSNGPEMRSPIAGQDQSNTVNDYTPEEFRTKIKSDTGLRQRFVRLFNLAKPVYSLNRSFSTENENIAYVMLEDNLDLVSYQTLRSIAQAELGGLVRFIRNPCPGCYEDNDIDPDQDNLEFHDPEHVHALRVGDGYSMDGKGLFFPGEVNPAGLSVEDTKTVISASLAQDLSYFALWRAERQGIIGTFRGNPDERNYEVPTTAQEQIEIELLRHGLEQEVVEEDEDDADLENTVRF